MYDAAMIKIYNEMVSKFHSKSYKDAIKLGNKFIIKNPNSVVAFKIIGLSARNIGDMELALSVFEKAIQINPLDAESHNNMGTLLYELRKIEESLLSFQKAIKVNPLYADAYCNIGNVYLHKQDNETALKYYKKAIEINSELPTAHTNLGTLYLRLGLPDKAEKSFRKSLKIKNLPGVQNNLGNALRMQGKYTDSILAYQSAIKLKPDFAEAYSNLGNSYKDLFDYKKAETSYRKCLEINPNFESVYNNLGSMLCDLDRQNDAIEMLQTAIDLKKDFAAAHFNLGNAFKKKGMLDCAINSYENASRIEPDNPTFKYAKELILPDIATSSESLIYWRARYVVGLENLKNWQHTIKDPINISNHTFNLSYNNESNIEIIKKRSELTRLKVENLDYVSPHVYDWTFPINRKIKIGICSKFLNGHTIGKLYAGIIKKLDREIFEVIVFHPARSKIDSFGKEINRMADRSIRLPLNILEQQKMISSESLDIMFYPDIGMTQDTYYLAHCRFAPVQVVSWGHPETSGISTIDYFISSDLIEGNCSEIHYTEKLIKFGSLPTFYSPIIPTHAFSSTTNFEIQHDLNLYGCLQSLFKLHPDFDYILEGILQQDKKARIVLLEGTSQAWSNILQERWSKISNLFKDRVIFIKRLPYLDFLNLLSRMHVLLDPIYFGSGSSMYEAVLYGIPTVTLPGTFMRGRIASGVYNQLKITNPPIVHNPDEYILKAVDLCRNFEMRNQIKNSILANKDQFLYNDNFAIAEFHDFFISSLRAAEQGKTLQNWASSSIKVTLQ